MPEPPHQAVVLPLPPRAARSRSAAPGPPSGPRPVSCLPVADSAHPDGCGLAAQQSMPRQAFEDTLTRVTGSIFRAGLSLHAALDQPREGLRQAAEHALGLLDDTVREARDAAFAGLSNRAPGLSDPAGRGSAQTGPARRDAVDSSAVQALLTRSRSIRAQSVEARARRRRVAVLSAGTEDRLAATLGQLAEALGQLAAACPHRSASLRALGQDAARRAAWMRQLAPGHAGTG